MVLIWWMTPADGTLVLEPTLEDLVASIIGPEHHPRLSQEEWLVVRLAYLDAFAGVMQAHFAEEALDAGQGPGELVVVRDTVWTGSRRLVASWCSTL